MKRYGNLYKRIYDLENLRLAHKNARKGKGWYKEVKELDENEEVFLKQLQYMLINKTYNTSEYQTFFKTDGLKQREIYKLPYFPDRICQWAILQVIEPFLMNNLTSDTYSAIPGRGIHLAKQKLNSAIYNDVPGTQYTFKMDAKKYYPSIDHTILKVKYRRLFKDEDLLWLLDEIIDSTEGDVGIPIGNYLSQYSGNYYLSEFDHWIKEVKKVKYYFRYMDDIVILGNSKEELHQLHKEIDYVGYRIFLNYSLLRKTTCKNFKKKMLVINKKRLKGEKMTFSEWCSINSYKGWLKWCDSYRLNLKYVEPLEQFSEDYYINNIKRKVA